MKNKRLNLNVLEVKSFITLSSEDARNALKGGGGCSHRCTLFCRDAPPPTFADDDCCTNH